MKKTITDKNISTFIYNETAYIKANDMQYLLDLSISSNGILRFRRFKQNIKQISGFLLQVINSASNREPPLSVSEGDETNLN